MRAKKAAPKPKRKSRAGRPPVVENHPKRDEILAALLTPGANYSAIQRKYRISDEALKTFRKKHVGEATQRMLDETAQVRDETPAMARDVMAKLDLLVDRGYRMLEAADAWLEDPNAPGKYNLNPRTHEVDVVWEREIPIGDDRFRTERKTEKLSKLLSDVEAGLGITVVKGETKTADPRKLLLEAVAVLKPVVELIGKATGQIKPDPAVSLTVFLGSPSWAAVEEALTEALKPHPEAALDVSRALARISGGADGR